MEEEGFSLKIERREGQGVENKNLVIDDSFF